MQIDSFDTIQFKYNTGQIPPPFCYMYSLEISETETGEFEASLNLEYFDREELTDEEIFNEGFSTEDNVNWHGELPKVWVDEIRKKLKSTNWKKKSVANDDGSEFIIKIVNENHAELMQPANTRIWEIFIQEIIQAIFELSKREAPLLISFVSKKGKTELLQIEFEYSFAHRAIDIYGHKKSMNWEEGQKLLKYIFGIDYNPEDGKQKITGEDGHYISPGDGLWYELKTGDKLAKEASNEARLAELLRNYASSS